MIMNKENILFGIIGVLVGLIVGFMFANSVNQGAGAAVQSNPAASAKQNSNMPAGHPDISGADNPGVTMADVQKAVDEAKAQTDNVEAQLKAAEVNYRIERYNEAIEYLKRANQIQPENREIVVYLGNANFDANNYEEAEKWYANALEKDPNDVGVRTDMGLTFIFRTPPDYDRAEKEFLRSLEIDPKHGQTLQNLTVAYTKKGDAAKAKATLARLEAADAKNASIAKLREEIEKIGVK